jgi:hypothetical protein
MSEQPPPDDEPRPVRSAGDEDVERLGRLVIGMPVTRSSLPRLSWLIEEQRRQGNDGLKPV